MRRMTTKLIIIVIFLAGIPTMMSSSVGAVVVAPPCAANSVRISDDNTVVGAGNVNDLFWIKNISTSTCTLRGYVRVEYVGVYGIGPTKATPHLLQVPETRSYGRDGNDLGGLKKGLPIPSVVLKEHGVASFWLYGTDEPHGTPPSRCIVAHKMLVWLPGSPTSLTVQPLRGNGFFWCGGVSAHPIASGESGSDPAVPLSYYFGVPTP